MKDNRDKQMAQLAGWTWDLSGYAAKVPFYNADDLTMREVQNVFQLDPEPPQMELNDYICEAVRKRDLSYFSSFLHHFEKRLNGVIYRFLTRSGYDRYDPARFLDYKLEVLQMLLYCLPKFDPEQETEFLKYAKHYIRDGLLFCRMMGEAGSFASLAEYRRVRKIGAIYNDSGKNRAEVVSEFAVQSGYMDESVSADELLTIAQRNRSIVSLYGTEQDEDGEETGEDVTRDDSWNYAEILWNGIQAKAVTASFEQLSYKEQWYLEKRNAICMTCGRVSPLSTQSTFEDLAVDFEGTTASGAERFYRRTLDKLRLKLLESGVIHTVTLKQTECRKRNKKIAAAVYLYQADNDGEWGELRFDFENGTAEIVRLADWDTVKSNIFAKTAIRFVQSLPEARLLKSVVVPFEMGVPEKPVLQVSAAKALKGNSSHTISLRQTECQKTGQTITAAVYEYLVDNDGEWGKLRFDFENGTAEIVKLADWDTVKSNVFAKAAIRFVQGLPETRLLQEDAVLARYV